MAPTLDSSGIADPSKRVADGSSASEATLAVTRGLEQLTGYAVYPQSIILHEDALFALAREGIEKKLLILSQRDEALMDFEGERQAVENDGNRSTLLICPLSAANAAALRVALALYPTADAGAGDFRRLR